jgi:two-component system LytT family response regulator
MITAIIIDDELKARENLKYILRENFSDVHVVALCGTIQDAVAKIQEHKPDLVFLDIMMKGETGFDLFDKLSDIKFDVVFVTAYDEYAMKALKMNAVDYILKPIDLEDLENALKKVNSKKHKPLKGDELRPLLEQINIHKNIQKIALPTLEGLVFVQINDIVRCESDENYTTFYFAGKTKKVVSKTIKYFEDLLLPHHFFRSHRSHLINLHHIREYIRGDGGYIVMSDGSEVMLARRKKEEFMKLFMAE